MKVKNTEFQQKVNSERSKSMISPNMKQGILNKKYHSKMFNFGGFKNKMSFIVKNQ